MAIEALDDMMALRSELNLKINMEWGRRTESALLLLDHLFEHPAVYVKKVQKTCDLSPKAAGDLVRSFEQGHILKRITGLGRKRLYWFNTYLGMLREHT